MAFMKSDRPAVVPIGGAGVSADTCFAQVDAYWQALCDGRIMPCRAEIDPRGIADVLDRTFLLERVAPGVARFRLAGMHLADLMGMEVRGMPISCFMLPEARAAFADAVESVFSEPAKVDLWLSGPSRLIAKPMAARMLLLPLRDGAGQVTRALGCLSSSAPVGSPPCRFRIASDNRVALTGYGTRPSSAAPKRASGPAAQGGPSLRLIDGGGS
ncbi:PAS domain-containing protein [Oceaniglobus indicus]|uniref:PAS domain-containing protein n=1 Tax=Oceaniglobus indicus TaxID=2047749 RepID=UPI000C17E2C8|nr:PAS domain-containing protein [Oceaniglobus indicus]